MTSFISRLHFKHVCSLFHKTRKNKQIECFNVIVEKLHNNHVVFCLVKIEGTCGITMISAFDLQVIPWTCGCLGRIVKEASRMINDGKVRGEVRKYA